MDARCLVGILAVVGVAGQLAAGPPQPTPEGVRTTINKLWSNVGDEAATALVALERDPLALPVVRRAMAVDPDKAHRGVLERLVEKAVTKRDGLLVQRIEQWSKDGRLDLLTEVRSLTDGKAAEAALDALLQSGRTLGSAGWDQAAGRLARPADRFLASLPWADIEALKKSNTVPAFDREMQLPERWDRRNLALFADRIDMPCAEVQSSVVVCRSGLLHLAERTPTRVGRCQWYCSMLFSNTTISFEEAGASLVVVDGDLKLAPGARIVASALVVNGNITEYGKTPSTSFTQSVVWAAGDITLTSPGQPHMSVFLAGGKVAEAEKLAAKGCVEENVKEPPLPVRFLDPAEFGLTLEVGKDGMAVKAVADKSAFADVLKAGDVVTTVSGVKTPSAAAFRRELRRGVIDGAVIFDVTRGKETLELLAAVPDVPPAPKKEPKAKPPEKK